ncbi:hypothetical protein SteCoe_21327 [Stentor coeruleus]|uniref:Uncharacterized protein n=1 Tax=Stentor coeruleus TaxID=5963 RepID=A0A1R2BPN7_9CILI|nr:hypothetical protein SteCoe_21327 [Stentor coeruleus]
MDSSHYPHTDIAFGISELQRRNIITLEEHTYLMQLLQDKNEDLIQIEASSKTFEEKQHELIKIARLWQKPASVQVPKSKQLEDNTSPLDTFLHEKKKRQHVETELKLSLAISEMISIVETQEEP